MITDIFLFIAGIGLGWGYRWLHTREALADMAAEVSHRDSIIVALHQDNADLATIIESHKSPWG